jgi:hypothetical protein
VEGVLPTGTGAPEARTTEVHKEAVVSHWLEYGDLSPVARRTKDEGAHRVSRQQEKQIGQG